MSGKIDFANLNVQDLLKSIYVIPDYQREYVWEEKQVNQLLYDSFNQFEANSEGEYFLGSMVVCKHSENNKFEVIDGQQRLLTLSLILNAFRMQLKSKGNPVSHLEAFLYTQAIDSRGEVISSNVVDVRYEGKEVIAALYKMSLGEEVGFSLIEGKPGKIIYEAHEAIEEFIKAELIPSEDLAKLTRFSGYLLNNIKIIRIETPEVSSALKIFETINERGVGLDQVDLLKNLLFMQIPRLEFDKLKEEWNKFKVNIQGGNLNEKPLRFLRYFIMSNYKIEPNDKSEIIIREDDVYEWFVNNETKCNYKSSSFIFVSKIQKASAFYISLMQNKFHDKDSLYLDNILKLVGYASKQHYILLLATMHFNPNQFNYFVKQLETVMFYYQITKEPARDLEKKFANWAQELQKIKTDKQLNSFIDSRFNKEIQDREESYRIGFDGIKYSMIQKYKLKYILAKFEAYIQTIRQDAEQISLSHYVKRNVHIEHILPDEPDKEVVEKIFAKDVKQYNLYKDKIGNLTLLEGPINTSVQNAIFDVKKDYYLSSDFIITKTLSKIDNVGKDTAVNRANEKLKSYSIWNKESIDDRQELLFKLSKEIWQITEIGQ